MRQAKKLFTVKEDVKILLVHLSLFKEDFNSIISGHKVLMATEV
jgi:hypothetical protein